jgi:hypothetical protein
MNARVRGDDAQSGIALIEIVLSLAVLTVLTVAVGRVLETGLGAYETTSPAGVRQLSHRAMDRIADRLSFAGLSTLDRNVLGSSLKFRACLGSTGGTKDYDKLAILRWRPEPEDPADGKDNDGDGLIDEGMVVLRTDVGEATERRIILVRGVARLLEGEIANGVDDNGNGEVDERGLLFQVEPNAVRVHLTLVRPGPDGRIVVRTARTLVSMRN